MSACAAKDLCWMNLPRHVLISTSVWLRMVDVIILVSILLGQELASKTTIFFSKIIVLSHLKSKEYHFALKSQRSKGI